MPENNINVQHQIINENGFFPNNPSLPVLLYKNVLEINDKKAAKSVEELFEKNNWSNLWRNGIYTYHHYHSITHEVLGIYRGDCTVALGGEDANTFHLEKGDVLIIPVGVAHKNVGSSDDFACVGAYPRGHDFDIKRGTQKDKEDAIKNIRKVPVPETDPVFYKGFLQEYWH